MLNLHSDHFFNICYYKTKEDIMSVAPQQKQPEKKFAREHFIESFHENVNTTM